MSGKQILIIISGPTASGKTAFSVELAKKLNGEIISADSMQVYRGMDIGTAKVRPEEMQGVTHHLIDIISPFEEWNVLRFCEAGKALIEDIGRRGRIPVLVGGTGFYIRALAYGAVFEEETESEEEKDFSSLSDETLHARLREVDENSACAIHAHNRKRTIRALSFYYRTGMRMSEWNEKQKQRESPYDILYYALSLPREVLYRRIEERIDRMLREGLLEEVRKLHEAGCGAELTSMKGLGYKELLPVVRGEGSLEEAVYVLKRDTRHFAKRQETWLRREKEVIRVPIEEGMTAEEILERAISLTKQDKADTLSRLLKQS